MNIELQTKRLILRPLQLDDLEALYEYTGDSEGIKYMLFLPHESLQEAKKFLQDAVAEWAKENPSYFEFGMELDGKLIGTMSAYREDDGREIEFGWVIHRDYRGQGFVTEAALAVKAFAIENLKPVRLTAHCDKRNLASARVMERIGLCFAGEGMREYRNGEKAAEYAYVEQLQEDQDYREKNRMGWQCSITNQEIYRAAMRQSAIDLNCREEDFLSQQNIIVYSQKNENARVYLELPFSCNLVSYGNNIVASVEPSLDAVIKDYISKYSLEHCFETPNMHVLNDALQERGLRICFMAEYFLPDVERLQLLPCKYEMKILTAADFKELYLPRWSNALCENRKEYDVLGVGAYDGKQLIGLACCSADCDTMWQIGVDVLPEYRHCGVASALTSRLAAEILKRGKIPFYCAAWCNIKSVRNAIRSGFRPAWVEMTAKSAAFVEQMNR